MEITWTLHHGRLGGREVRMKTNNPNLGSLKRVLGMKIKQGEERSIIIKDKVEHEI